MTYAHALSLLSDDEPTFTLRAISSADVRGRLTENMIDLLGLDQIYLWPDGVLREEVEERR